jgi:hypothetical protein
MRQLALILALAAAGFAQGTSGIATSVSRTVSIQPDEGNFTAVVTTSLNTTQDQVVQFFQNAGVQNLSVTGAAAGANNAVYPPADGSSLFYQIAFTVAPPAMKEYAKKLDGMRAALPAGITGLQYSAILVASTAAVETARQATFPLLIADARAKAQAIAAAAGLKLGGIQGIGESSYGLGVPAAAFVSSPFFGSSNTSSGGTQFTFFASVTFTASGQ